jgi:heat-inducible transcriptional repressor
MLTERKSQILKIIANGYITSAVPVASSTVARTRGLGVSAATVRNEMVALEDDGYIHRPHISAGAVPSDKGYRQLVEWLDHKAGLQDRDADRVRTVLSESAEDVDEWANTAAGILAALLDTVAFATPIHSSAPSIKGIELLELQEMLVMLVVVMQEAVVYRQLISTTHSLTTSDLEHARNRVNDLVAGKSLAELRSEEGASKGDFNHQVVQSTMQVVRRHETERLKSRKLQGLSRLFRQPEFEEDPERAQMAITAIESDDVFEDLMLTASNGQGAIAVIGSENEQSSLKKFSVVVCDYGVGSEASGVVGILAPTRLSYERAIPLISHAGSSLSGIVGRVYGHS